MARSRGTPLELLNLKDVGKEKIVAGIFRKMNKLSKLAHIHLPDTRGMSDDALLGIVNLLAVGQYRRIIRFHDRAASEGLPDLKRPAVLNAIAVARLMVGHIKEAEELISGLLDGGFSKNGPALRSAI